VLRVRVYAGVGLECAWIAGPASACLCVCVSVSVCVHVCVYAGVGLNCAKEKHGVHYGVNSK